MTIKKVYEIAVNDAQSRSPRTGYSQDQTNQLELWTTRIAGLASFLGWKHKIIANDCTDEYESVMEKLEKIIPDKHEFLKYVHTYEIAGIIDEDKHIPFGQI